MLNKCCFIGNLGRDPEIRFSQAGKKIANLSLGVTEKWKNAAGEKQERTEWVRLVVFNDKLADVAEKYLRKGSKIYIEGQMQTRKWADQGGVEKYTTEIILSGFNGTLVMLDGKPKVERQDADPSNQSPLDDSVPF